MFGNTKLRRERDEARRVAENLRSSLIKTQGELSTIRLRHGALASTAAERAFALLKIVAAIDSITTPNGTLRKVRRIAKVAVDRTN